MSFGDGCWVCACGQKVATWQTFLMWPWDIKKLDFVAHWPTHWGKRPCCNHHKPISTMPQQPGAIIQQPCMSQCAQNFDTRSCNLRAILKFKSARFSGEASICARRLEPSANARKLVHNSANLTELKVTLRCSSIASTFTSFPNRNSTAFFTFL